MYLEIFREFNVIVKLNTATKRSRFRQNIQLTWINNWFTKCNILV